MLRQSQGVAVHLLPWHRPRPRRLASLAAVVVAVAVGLVGPPATGSGPRALAPSGAALIGQKLVVAMSGTSPSAALPGRIGLGELGGVIPFGRHITSPTLLQALCARRRPS